MNRPLPEEERRRRHLERKRVWNAEHRDYKAEWRERNIERVLKDNRDNMREKYAAEKKRRLEVERVKEWSKANPDKRRETRERYKEQNPEKYRAAQREYYHRNKEAIAVRRLARQGLDPEKLRADRRRDAGRRTETAEKWVPTDEQREKYRAQAREKKQLVRRLKAASLPEPRVRRTLVSERRVNLVAAEEFFSRKRSREEVRRIAARGGDEILMRGWSRYSTLARRRNEFLDAVQHHLVKHGPQLSEEVAMDSRARQLRGKDPLDEAAETRRRAIEAVRLAYEGMAPLRPSAPITTTRAVQAGRSLITPTREAER